MSADQPSPQISSFVARYIELYRLSRPTNSLTGDFLTGATNVLKQKRHTGKLAAITATSIYAAVAANAADVTAPKLMLTTKNKGAGGESVMAGKYDEALTE